VVTGIRNFDYDPGRGRFRAWLGTVVANKIKRFLGRNSKRRETGLPSDFESEDFDKVYNDPDSNWVEVFSGQILAEACRTCRAEFEEKTWRCFEATWAEKESPGDVANELGIAVHAVYVNKSRVLKRLESEIRNLAEDLAYDFPDAK
jgi:RNA polymerase sigma-70 factor (ECF subfamily)